MVKHLLGSYGSQFVSEDGAHCFKLSERKVRRLFCLHWLYYYITTCVCYYCYCHLIYSLQICRLFAEMLLRDVGKFNLSEFFEVWKGSLPAGMTSDEKYLSVNIFQILHLFLNRVNSPLQTCDRHYLFQLTLSRANRAFLVVLLLLFL